MQTCNFCRTPVESPCTQTERLQCKLYMQFIKEEREASAAKGHGDLFVKPSQPQG